MIQDGEVEGHVLTSSCESTKITTSCWGTSNRRMLEPTKKIPHLQRQRSHSEMVDGRRGTITMKPNPPPAGWVTRTREQRYQRSSPTVVKVLNLTSGFPAWVSNKGTGNPQGIWPCRPVGFDHRIGGKQRLQSWEGRNKTLCATKTQGRGAVAPQGLTTGMGAPVWEGPSLM